METPAESREVELHAFHGTTHEKDKIAFGCRAVALDLDPVIAGDVLLLAAFLARICQLLARDLDEVARLAFPPGGRELGLRVVAFGELFPEAGVARDDRLRNDVDDLASVNALLDFLLVDHGT
jgi:hypothetical protein